MLETIRHRGPDEIGIDKYDDYIIGNVRLSIIGDKSGKQPIKNKNNCLIYNGEIYNFKEINKEYLDAKINTESDTEILFHFLTKYQTNNLNVINGMFSFVLFRAIKYFLQEIDLG